MNITSSFRTPKSKPVINFHQNTKITQVQLAATGSLRPLLSLLAATGSLRPLLSLLAATGSLRPLLSITRKQAEQND